MNNWIGNQHCRLPNVDANAWMMHGRSVGEDKFWVATLNVYAPGFKRNLTLNVYGVQDDFGNFVEVPYV